MAAGAPAAFQSENTRVRPPFIDVFHVRSSSTARHTKCNSRQTRRGSASPQSAHSSSLFCNGLVCFAYATIWWWNKVFGWTRRSSYELYFGGGVWKIFFGWILANAWNLAAAVKFRGSMSTWYPRTCTCTCLLSTGYIYNVLYKTR